MPVPDLASLRAKIEDTHSQFPYVSLFLNKGNALDPLDQRLPKMITVFDELSKDKSSPEVYHKVIGFLTGQNASMKDLHKLVMSDSDLRENVDKLKPDVIYNNVDLMNFLSESNAASSMVMKHILGKGNMLSGILATSGGDMQELNDILLETADKTGLKGLRKLLALEGDAHENLLQLSVSILERDVPSDPNLTPLLDEARQRMAEYTKAWEVNYADRQLVVTDDEETSSQTSSVILTGVVEPPPPSTLVDELALYAKLVDDALDWNDDAREEIRSLKKADKLQKSRIETLTRERDTSSRRVKSLVKKLQDAGVDVPAFKKPNAAKKPDAEKKPRAVKNPDGEKKPRAVKNPDGEKKPRAVKKPNGEEKPKAAKKLKTPAVVNHSLKLVASTLSAGARNQAKAVEQRVVIDHLGGAGMKRSKAEEGKKDADGPTDYANALGVPAPVKKAKVDDSVKKVGKAAAVPAAPKKPSADGGSPGNADMLATLTGNSEWAAMLRRLYEETIAQQNGAQSHGEKNAVDDEATQAFP
jgi:uncharacterized protein (UPF0335 family)